MKPIHVLSIGNSFSQDAHRYLHDLARSAGVAIEAVNLYIGGCSLERHYRNMVGNKREYMLEINGHRGDGFLCSMDEALSARAWDFITLQQASPQSFLMESYEPYLQRLAEHIRYMCPKAKLLLHQTWGYESGSERIKACGFNTYEEMFFRVKSCYEKAAADVRADGIIPAGIEGRNQRYPPRYIPRRLRNRTIHSGDDMARLFDRVRCRNHCIS